MPAPESRGNGASGDSTISITSSSANSSILNLGDSFDIDIGQIKYSNSSDSMQFITGTVQRMLINSSGIDVTGTADMDTLSIGGTAVTSTAAELNILDGVTATTTEINYVDGVTSNIQTQLDAKTNDGDNLGIYIQISRGADSKRNHAMPVGIEATRFAFAFEIPPPPPPKQVEPEPTPDEPQPQPDAALGLVT